MPVCSLKFVFLDFQGHKVNLEYFVDNPVVQQSDSLHISIYSLVSNLLVL